MIGWLKLDKDMIDDPRVMEIAAQLRDVLHYRVVYMRGHGGSDLESNAELTALRCVTLGALVTMWRYAHDHINNDDVLPMGLDALDTVIGIEGFCGLLPPEWLVELNDMGTKLPGYCAKNNLIGKEKAASNNAQRQARYRERHKGEPKPVSAKHETKRNTGSNGVTSNAVTLIDQDLEEDQDQDQDQDQDSRIGESTMVERTRPKQAEPPEFLQFKLAYPKRAGSQPWGRALQAIHARLSEGHSWDEILDGVRRYADFCSATGKVGTEHVQQASRFCGPGQPPEFLQAWSLPATRAETRLAGNLASAEEFMRRTETKQ